MFFTGPKVFTCLSSASAVKQKCSQVDQSLCHRSPKAVHIRVAPHSITITFLFQKMGTTNVSLQNGTDGSGLPWMYDIKLEDTNWIITSSFMIFTMQTGK